MPKVTTTTTLKGGKKWTATLHPRGKGGKFTKKVGTPTESDKLRTKVSRKVLAKALSTKGLSLKKLATPKHDYSKMSLVELKGLAAKLGAKHPDKYKNRKQAWADVISAHIKGSSTVPQVTKVTTPKKTEPKPKAVTKVTKTTTSKPKATVSVTSAKAKLLVKHVEANLDKYKVADLKKIAEDLGAKAPTKYATRKQAWLDSIKAHVGFDVVPQVTKVTKTVEPKPKEKVKAKSEKKKANPNLGSKERNIRANTWKKLQLANPDIDDDIKELIKQPSTLRPFPLGDSRTRQKAWIETTKNAYTVYEIGQEAIRDRQRRGK